MHHSSCHLFVLRKLWQHNDSAAIWEQRSEFKWKRRQYARETVNGENLPSEMSHSKGNMSLSELFDTARWGNVVFNLRGCLNLLWHYSQMEPEHQPKLTSQKRWVESRHDSLGSWERVQVERDWLTDWQRGSLQINFWLLPNCERMFPINWKKMSKSIIYWTTWRLSFQKPQIFTGEVKICHFF